MTVDGGEPRDYAIGSTIAPGYRLLAVHNDGATIGELELRNLEAIVHESGLPIVLLGSNFLDRYSMRREQQEMILTPR